MKASESHSFCLDCVVRFSNFSVVFVNDSAA